MILIRPSGKKRRRRRVNFNVVFETKSSWPKRAGTNFYKLENGVRFTPLLEDRMRQRRMRGFTLVEVMVTLAALGLVLLVIFGAFRLGLSA